MEDLFGVRQVLECLRVWQLQGLATERIPRRLPQRGLVDEQPRLLHPHRNDANSRQRLVSRTPPQGLANLCLALVYRLALGVSVNEEQIARIQLDTFGDALIEFPGRISKTTQIREFRLNGDASEMLPQQPDKNRNERPI